MITNRPTRDELIEACQRAIERFQARADRDKEEFIQKRLQWRVGPFWRQRNKTRAEAEADWQEHNKYGSYWGVLVGNLKRRLGLLQGMPVDASIMIDSDFGDGSYPKVDALLFVELYGEATDFYKS